MIKIIYDSSHHRNILIGRFGNEQTIESNIHFIMHNGKGILLDPGGQKILNDVVSNLSKVTKICDIEAIFLSHQDPDVVAAINSWLRITNAKALCADKWQRFIPHFGVETELYESFIGIPDTGMNYNINGCELKIIPAHFLHSVANFQIYDPVSKILYSGDLGTSVGAPYTEVSDFKTHIDYMLEFHRRYMLNNAALKLWLHNISSLDIEIIAPQHGARLVGKEQVQSFMTWCHQLQCGTDILLQDLYKIPVS